MGLKQNGSIIEWGDIYFFYIPEPNSGFTSISAGGNFSLGIRQSCGYALAGDMTDDCRIDFADFAVLAEQWLLSDIYCADIAPEPDGDGSVDMLDLAVMASNWLIDCNVDPGNPACVLK